MTKVLDDVTERLVNSHHSTNPFHTLVDVTSAHGKQRPDYAPQRAPFHPAVEPRTQEPSFHSPLLASLPLEHLTLFRNAAIHDFGVNTEDKARGHMFSLLQPFEPQTAKNVHKQAFAQNLPRMAFTPRSARSNR